MRFGAILAISLVVAAVGCKKSDPKNTAAWLKACHANEYVMQNGTPEYYNTKMLAWIKDHAKDDQVNASFVKANTLSAPEDKSKYIKSQASNAGIDDCPVADALWPPPPKK